jgi:arylsulfatase A
MTGVLVLLLLCLSLRNGVVSSAKPNILLFLADDLGYGDLAAFGHPTSESPHLNKLLRESLLLTNFYAASPVCSPSRAALLTGLYPVTTGIWPGVLLPDSVGGLNESHITVASRLKVVGYYTAHIGKWHLGVGRQGEFLPTKRGFQRYLGVPYSHDMCPCDKCFPEEDGRCHGFCRQDSVGCPLFVNTNIYEQPVDLTTLTQKYTTAAVATIAHSINDLKVPFFLYMAYQHPHHPQFAGQQYE